MEIIILLLSLVRNVIVYVYICECCYQRPMCFYVQELRRSRIQSKNAERASRELNEIAKGT